MKRRREFKVVPNYIPTDSDLEKVDVIIVGGNKDKLNDSMKVLEKKELPVFQIPNKVGFLSEFFEADGRYKLAKEYCEDSNLYALYPPLSIHRLNILGLNHMFGGGFFMGGSLKNDIVIKVI